MFDKFGEFNSYQELNLAAEGLKNEGDTESLYQLAAENGIEKEDAEDYIAGDTPELATLSMAAFGRLAVLEQEEINSKKSQIEKMPLQVILAMLKGMCTEKMIAEAVMTRGKRLSYILDAMKNEASKHKVGNMAMICGTDRQLCEIIKVYYTDSDKSFKEALRACIVRRALK